MSSSGALGFGSYRRVVAGAAPLPMYFSPRSGQPPSLAGLFFRVATADQQQQQQHGAAAAEKPSLSPLLYTRSANSFTTTSLLLLRESHRRVLSSFLVRDRVIQPLVLPATSKGSQDQFYEGLFALTPERRRFYHNKDVMESIRLRSLLMRRIQVQRKRSEALLEEIQKAGSAVGGKEGAATSLRSPSFVTPDSNVYFAPWQTQSEKVSCDDNEASKSGNSSFFMIDGTATVNALPNYWQHASQAHVVPHMRWRRMPDLDNITRVMDPLTEQANDY